MLEETPHIFFAGNQPEYSSRLVQGNIRLMASFDNRGGWTTCSNYMHSEIQCDWGNRPCQSFYFGK